MPVKFTRKPQLSVSWLEFLFASNELSQIHTIRSPVDHLLWVAMPIVGHNRLPIVGGIRSFGGRQEWPSTSIIIPRCSYAIIYCEITPNSFLWVTMAIDGQNCVSIVGGNSQQ